MKAEGVPIDGYKFTYQSRSKEEIIKALRDQFEKKGFVIPYKQDDVETMTQVRALINELTKFGIVFDHRNGQVKFEGTGKHDDMVISLALANYIARHITMGMFSAVTSPRKNKSPFFIAKS